MLRLRFRLDGTVAKDITVPSRWNLIGLCYLKKLDGIVISVATEITVPSNFFKFSPRKDLAPFSIHTPQKTLF